MDIVLPEWMQNPIEVYRRNKLFRDWASESGNIKCDCGEIIHISSCMEQHGEKLCRKCNLMYEFWNNRDGSGLRFTCKGYFPFYPDGFKYTITKIHNEKRKT